MPEDRQTLGELRQRAQQIFASEQRANQGRPLGWEAKQAIVKQLIDEGMSDALMPAVDRRFFQPGQENAPPGNLSNSAAMLENLLYTRSEGEAPAGLLKLLNGAGENDSGSNTAEPPASKVEDDVAVPSADQTPGTGGEQLAANTPTQSPTAPQSQCPSLIGPVPVPGYTEKGQFNWRACNDQVFIDAANNYNRSYGLQADDRGYITPQLLKAWAIIENGDNKDQFLSDPFTANNPLDWDNAKTRIAGLQRGEAMTPEKSARAALEWMRYKSFRPGGNGTLAGGLRNYSGGMDLHDAASRKPYFDYHPGAVHREWYPAAILGLEAKMLGMVRPQMD